MNLYQEIKLLLSFMILWWKAVIMSCCPRMFGTSFTLGKFAMVHVNTHFIRLHS